MKYIRCDYGHYYDPEKYTSCPHCAAFRAGEEPEYTVAKKPVDEQVMDAYSLRENASAKKAAPVKAQPAPLPEDDDPVTVARVAEEIRIDPPVGWLVEVDGPHKGEAFVIHSERNTIGRGSGMNICLKGDLTVSRENNAVLSYNPRNREFHLIPGEGKAIVYVNGNELLTPAALCAYDRIEIGHTALLFLPLCGERFAWEDAQ